MTEEIGGKAQSEAAGPAAPDDRRDWRENPPACPYCTRAARLVRGDEIYPGRDELAARRFWACWACGAWCGVHRNSRRAAPLGSLANSFLRLQRMRVHAELDPIWRNGEMGRRDAYAWLAERMGLDVRRCHVGYFREAQCASALAILAERKGRRS